MTEGLLSPISWSQSGETCGQPCGSVTDLRRAEQLADKRNQREQLCIAIWDKVKRVRASVRGIYGDDSTQYELVGGTRMSDRKTHVRKVSTTE
jgi:hypothetical protein